MSRAMKRAICLLGIVGSWHVISLHTIAIAQEVDRDSLRASPLAGTPSAASPFLVGLVIPAPIAAGYRTRDWVRDSLPRGGGSVDDLARLDMIYLRALGESEGDLESTMLASLIATFEHQTIPLSFGINLPLTLEPDDSFERRVAVLPRHLFIDNPRGDDRDKLQHFFASAWLAIMLDNGTLADVIGLGIESGEEAFIRGGANDSRDVRANRLGHLFIEMLREHPETLPSMLFRAWNRGSGQ